MVVRRLQVNDVVRPNSERDVAAKCEAAGINFTPDHRLYKSMTGTIVSLSGSTAMVFLKAGVTLEWPLETLTAVDSLPPHVYDRNLLNQVRLQRGKSLKALREEVQTRPTIMKKYIRSYKTEVENQKQKVQMMWVVDAKSKVRHVENSSTYNFVYTNPIGTGVVPRYQKPSQDQFEEKFSIGWHQPKKTFVKQEVPEPPRPSVCQLLCLSTF
eukprot:TRINITY_DN9454_c0_g1_i2.p1 TRINITY_DN9454_c0_g1~~TRINITY_DN9454_c0_g1_i2.p1  ORF type:complete len:227 (+),score=41.40 TRINITY_DN9454_c0_g1_i2:46-681(+)